MAGFGFKIPGVPNIPINPDLPINPITVPILPDYVSNMNNQPYDANSATTDPNGTYVPNPVDPNSASSGSDFTYNASDHFNINKDNIYSENALLQLMDQMVKQQYEYNNQSVLQQMEFNHNEAQLNRDFQEMMSNTSYQRAVSDMLKAGLNPALMYQNAQGASTPSGSAASGSTSAVSNIGSSLISSLSEHWLYTLVDFTKGMSSMLSGLLKVVPFL